MATVIKFPSKVNDIELAAMLIENLYHENSAIFEGRLIGWISNLLQTAPDEIKQAIIDKAQKENE